MIRPWPLDIRLGPGDLFEMGEIALHDPDAFGPDVRAALADEHLFSRHQAAQIAEGCRRDKQRRVAARARA